MSGFTADEVERCREAMTKPAPRQALADIASGRMLVSLTKDRRNCYLESFDGRQYLDRGSKMTVSGAWPLYRAGMINEFGVVTAEGHALLSAPPRKEGDASGDTP